MPDTRGIKKSSQRPHRKREDLESHIDFLYELYTNGIPLSQEDFQLLIDKKRIDTTTINQLLYSPKAAGPKKRKEESQFQKRFPTKEGMEIDKTITSVKDDEPEIDFFKDQDVIVKELVTQEEIEEEWKSEFNVISIGREIEKSDWLPAQLINHSQEFIDWIDSINAGFQTKREYSKFNLYKQQAERWYNENDSIVNYEGDEAKYEYAMQEFARCAENSLYAANKRFYLKDPLVDGGKLKFYATDKYEHQRVICYLIDCGYSLLIGKPRQPGLTSMVSIVAMNRLISRRNYFIKFITEDLKDTGHEIFEDKLKFSFYSLDDWFIPATNGIPDVLNDRDNLFRIGRKGQKGRIGGLNSKIQVVAPSKTAINGGTPPFVLVDEVGSIPILTEMLNEGRPTMFRRNRDTGEMELRGQCILFGTGTTSKGGAAFEAEWKRFMGLWKEREFSAGIIPIFFDWTTRCDEIEYLQQKKYYYGARATDENIDVETSKVQFHQHFPTYPSDMFATTQKLLASRDFIDRQIKKCEGIDPIAKPQYGYFEPIMDMNKPMQENSDTAYAVIGAKWIPTEEYGEGSTTIIFSHPKEKWKDRYYAGTDPIASDTGTSKMSLTIWDKYYNTVSCVVNHRKSNDPNYSFQQCMLASMYYSPDRNKCVPELIEKNIGLAYKNYRINHNTHHQLLFNAQLLPVYQSGEKSNVGIDNKGVRNQNIIKKMQEIINVFGDKIYIPVIFEQLRTFSCNTTRSGIDRWGTIDHRYYFDDVLFSMTFSYICAESIQKTPKYLGDIENNTKIIWVNQYDSNWNMVRKQVRVPA